MAVTFESAGFVCPGWTGAGPFTSSGNFSIAAGANRALFVIVGFKKSGGAGSCSVTGVTYNGVAMAFVTSIDDGSVGKAELWQLAAPATGSNTLTVTFTGTPDAMGSAYLSLRGVDQTTLTTTMGVISGVAISTATFSANAYTGNYGLWGGTFIAGGLGFAPTPATVLTSGNSTGIVNSGGIGMPNDNIFRFYGAIAGGTGTPTANANNGGSNYTFASMCRVINATPDEPVLPSSRFGCPDVAWRTEPRDT